MSSNACTEVTSLTRGFAIALICFALAMPAQAIDWAFWKKRDSRSRTQRELANARTLAIEPFAGSTGSTAQERLTAQLSDNPYGLRVLPKATRFTLKGTSNGGRIDAALLDREGKPLFERTYAAPGMQDNVKALADDVLFVITGRQGLASSQLAFVSDLSGTKQIYVCDADGTNVEQVTRHRFGSVSPAISPDFLGYTCYERGFSTVLLVDLGGGRERQVATTPGLNSGIAFAPDGQRAALTMSFVGNPEIFVLELASHRAVCITDSVGTPSSPSWHPDGTRIVYSSDEGDGPQLYTTRTDGDHPTQRWPVGYRFATDPEWSPDGKSVAFTVRIGNDLAVGTKAYPDGPTKIVQRNAQHPTWSPDGQALAYVQNGQLWIHDLTAPRRRSIVSGRGEISEPCWAR